jgi:hypothetical protein
MAGLLRGDKPPLTLSERARLRELEREVRELRDQSSKIATGPLSHSARQYQREADDWYSSKRPDARAWHAWRIEQAIGGSSFVLADVAGST